MDAIRRRLLALLVLSGTAVLTYRYHTHGKAAIKMKQPVTDPAPDLADWALEISGLGKIDTLPDDTLEATSNYLDARLGPTSHQSLADFETVVAAVIADDFASNRTVNVGGWIMSEFEASLLSYAATLHAKSGRRLSIPDNSFETASSGDIVSVRSWGPQRTCPSKPFQLQSDSSCAIWFKLADQVPNLNVFLNGKSMPVTLKDTFLTIRISPEECTKMVAREGNVTIDFYDPLNNVRQRVGHFTIAKSLTCS